MERRLLALLVLPVVAAVGFLPVSAGQVSPAVKGPVPVYAAFDGSGGFDALNGAAGVEAFRMGGGIYGMVTSRADAGVQLMDITEPARPAPVSAIFDDSGGFDALGGAAGVAVYDAGGRTYGMVAAAYDHVVQLMGITNPAHPAPVSVALDYYGFGALYSAAGVDVFGISGLTYGIVTAPFDSGVQIVDVTPSTPNRLDASVRITGHERLAGGDNDLVQITVAITNNGLATPANDDQDGTALSGELHVSLNALRK